MEKISWTNRVRNVEVLHRVKERNILHTSQIRKANRIGHILRRNCFLKHVTERKTEVNIRRARRSRQVLGDFTEKKDIIN
jgi:ribosomal protein L35